MKRAARKPGGEHDGNRIARCLVLLLALVAAGCSRGGTEGSPCTAPSDGGAEDQCTAGLTCQRPSRCTEYYCCPTPASLSSNASCNGSTCAGS
jgi:hypothetical protein